MYSICNYTMAYMYITITYYKILYSKYYFKLLYNFVVVFSIVLYSKLCNTIIYNTNNLYNSE